MKPTVTLSASLLLALLSTAFADDLKPKHAPTSPTATAPIVVPMELLPSGHFVVAPLLNGKGPFRFVLDTGAPMTIINSRTAKAGDLTKKKAGGGGLMSMFGSMQGMTVDMMELGELKAEKTTAMVMNHPTVEALSEAFKKDFGPVEGLIGFPFFARYAMTVDYRKKELTFVPNGYKPGDYLEDLVSRLGDTDTINKPKMIAPGGLWGFEVAKGKTDTEAGMVVTKVYADGPAAAGGLAVGDRLLTLDGRWTDSPGDAALATQSIKPGTPTAAVLKRDQKEITLSITPLRGR